MEIGKQEEISAGHMAIASTGSTNHHLVKQASIGLGGSTWSLSGENCQNQRLNQ
jgi:hypothetical protein